MLAVLTAAHTVGANADSGETVRVRTAKELNAAIGRSDVGTIILRTESNVSITIKSADAAGTKNLIVDSPNAVITNKAVFANINIISVSEFIENVSGNDIVISDGGQKVLTVSAKKQVKSLTIFNSYGYFHEKYTLRKGAKIKSVELVYSGSTGPVKSSFNKDKRKLSIKFTNDFGIQCKMVIKLDKSGRMTAVNSSAGESEFTYDYSYTYDKNGNITGISGQDSDRGVFKNGYVYSGNVLQKYTHDGFSNGSIEYFYDKKGKLIRETASFDHSIDGIAFRTAQTVNYEYDKKGRLVHQEDNETTEYLNNEYPSSSSLTDQTFAYNSSGLLTSRRFYVKSPSEEFSYTHKFKYDKAGNMIKETVYFKEGATGEEKITRTNEYTYDELGERL